jgi:hypothetical protein
VFDMDPFQLVSCPGNSAQKSTLRVIAAKAAIQIFSNSWIPGRIASLPGMTTV